jgi:glycosyltransferase involved in cell wall biosynthesis
VQKNTQQKKISVITVTYNNLSGLIKTINSVKEQSFENYEHIVIDGNSNDGSQVFLSEQALHNKFIFLSENDNGIFNAMNKGIYLSSGDWLLFLNAGDVFPSNTTLENVYMKGDFETTKLELIYGDKIDSSGQIVRAKSELSCLYNGEMPACHQSIFFRNNIKYDESYKIYGDIDLLSKIYLTNPHYQYIPLPISVFEGGGISSKITWKKRKEKFKSLLVNFGFICILKNYIFNITFYKKIFIWT